MLTKEACATVATLLTLPTHSATRDQFSRVGQLLLSTLTSLKHAGAAFAARDALQQITSFTFSPNAQVDIHSLPIEWSNRLLDEISLTEKVRNSTLRRSTGYALGFMAIMRAEAQARCRAHVTIKTTLDRLLTLSLPPTESIHAAFARLKMQTIQLSAVALDSYEVRLCCLLSQSHIPVVVFFTYKMECEQPGSLPDSCLEHFANADIGCTAFHICK